MLNLSFLLKDELCKTNSIVPDASRYTSIPTFVSDQQVVFCSIKTGPGSLNRVLTVGWRTSNIRTDFSLVIKVGPTQQQ